MTRRNHLQLWTVTLIYAWPIRKVFKPQLRRKGFDNSLMSLHLRQMRLNFWPVHWRSRVGIIICRPLNRWWLRQFLLFPNSIWKPLATDLHPSFLSAAVSYIFKRTWPFSLYSPSVAMLQKFVSWIIDSKVWQKNRNVSLLQNLELESIAVVRLLAFARV